ncbi:MAG TPA: hydroxymethylglutaryl-CoA lyase [Bacteroidia bacterium]|nr:hydroxymethylglutaryl-CoA lyase [Bacteroidia bacterium]
MNSSNRVFITECPRDAMQGIQEFIPTSSKIDYLNTLLEVGFDRLDFGSFVSPKAIPQLRDTAEVLSGLNLNDTTKLLAIVANLRGAQDASAFKEIAFLGFPFSVSETFQKRNTNSGIAESFETVQRMNEVAISSGKELLIYISMAFGNPYNDPWNADIVVGWIEQLQLSGITKIALADTVGMATAENVAYLTGSIINEFPKLEIGAHLHCHPGNWKTKVEAAYNAGCRHFDSALKGFGGCPMAEDELVGNLATENLVQYLSEKNVETRIGQDQFNKAMLAASGIFHL